MIRALKFLFTSCIITLMCGAVLIAYTESKNNLLFSNQRVLRKTTLSKVDMDLMKKGLAIIVPSLILTFITGFPLLVLDVSENKERGEKP